MFDSSRSISRSVSSPSISSPKTDPSHSGSKVSVPVTKSPLPIQRSQSTPGLLNPSTDLPAIERTIGSSDPGTIRQRTLKVPVPKALQLHLSSSPVKTLDEALERHGQLGALGSGLKGVEKSLRNTFFKTRSQRNQLMNQAMAEVTKNLNALDDKPGLLNYAKAAPPKEIKDQLARIVGAMRPDKYGTDSTYTNLSANKKALVDSMYKAMMAETIDQSGSLHIPVDQSKDPIPVGAKSIATRDFQVFDNGQNRTIKKGEPCIFHERDGKFFIQRMTRDESKKDGALGSYKFHKNMIEIDSSDLVKSKSLKFKAVTTPLFEAPASPSDIRQGAIGDCFLIAPIYDLARRNPETIHNMMKDNGDGTVTVRLFEKQGDNTFKPQFITVDKSVPDNDAHAEDVLWVQMIEKAYAVQQGSFDSITYGGHSHEVFESLLGVSSTKSEMPSGVQTAKGILETKVQFYELLPSVMNQITEQAKHFGFTPEQIDSLSNISSANLDQLFVLNDVCVTRLEQETGVAWPQLRDPLAQLKLANESGDQEQIDFAKQNMKEAQAKFRPLQKDFNDLLTYGPTQKALGKFIQMSPTYLATQNSPMIKKDVVAQIITELSDITGTITVEGKTYQAEELAQDLEVLFTRGDFAAQSTMDKLGVEMDYSDQVNTFFEGLEKQLAEGKHVALGSKETIGVSTGLGASGGESQVDGLAGSHAYAVMDTMTMNGRKFVRIANPWGNDFSRDYTLDGGKLVAKQHKEKSLHTDQAQSSGGQGIAVNESWIELHELTNLFSSVYVTDS